LMLSSQIACLILARVSVALFPRSAQSLMLIRSRIHHEIASGQIHDSKQNDVKNAYPPSCVKFCILIPKLG
jgi:hypothetical protein